MDERRVGRAPDFTPACIVMFGVNVAWVLLLLYALYGLVMVVFAGLVLNHAITWVEARRRKVAPAPTHREP